MKEIRDNDAEVGMLSCMLHYPDVIGHVQTTLYPDCFSGINNIIYEKLVWMWNENIGVEYLTLKIELKNAGLLSAEIRILLKDMEGFDPIPAHYNYYLKILKDKYTLNVIAGASQGLIEECNDKKKKPREILDDLGTLIKEAKQFHSKSDEIFKLSDIAKGIEWEVNNFDKQKVEAYVKTGLKAIDNIVGKLEGNTMFVVAARPSYGKTSLAMNVAESVALTGTPVGVFSLEMSAIMLTRRLIQSLSCVNLDDLTKGGTRQMWKQVTLAIGKLQEANNIYIDDTPQLDVDEFKIRAQRLVDEKKIGLIAVDYIQLMTKASIKNREQEISYISQTIKGVSKTLNVPIIVCAQLNRKVESRKSGKPILSDLRESGSIEQDADIVGLLSRDWDDNKNIIQCGLDIAKNRNGPTGFASLLFIKNLSKFVDPFYNEDHPF